MIIPVAALLLVLAPGLFGGRLRRLGGLRLRHPWLIVATLAVQVVVVELPFGPHWLMSAVHDATYLAAAAFVWLNRRIPGLLVVCLGAACNGLAIAINGGTLPASASALRMAGMRPSGRGFVNSGVVAHPRLAFLGDVFAVPSSWPLHNVFSVGDLVIVLGAGYASLRICGAWGLSPWTPPEPQPAGSPSAGPRHLAAAPAGSAGRFSPWSPRRPARRRPRPAPPGRAEWTPELPLR